MRVLDYLCSPRTGYVIGPVAVTLVSALLGATISRDQAFRADLAIFLMMIAVLLTASSCGRGPAAVTALVAFLWFDYFFIEPIYMLRLADPWDWLVLGLFLATALVTGQLAGALRHQADEARRREREAVALYEVIREVPASTLELRPLLGLILARLERVVECHASEIVTLERGDLLIQGYRGPLPHDRVIGFRLDDTSAFGDLLRQVTRTWEPVVLPDLGGVSLLAQDLQAAGVGLPPEVLGRDRAEIAVPLIAAGEVIGIMTLIHATPAFYNDRHTRLAVAFAQQAALAIQNARTHESALQREQELTASIVETAEAMIVVIDAQGRIVRWNRFAERLTGQPSVEVEGRSIWEVLNVPAEAEWLRLELEHLPEADMAREWLGAWIDPDGDRRSLQWSTATVRTDGVPHYVVAVGLDVTERQRAQEELHQAHARLELRVEERTRELASLYRADEVLYASLKVEDVLQALVDVATSVLGADKAIALVPDATGERMVVAASRGIDPDRLAGLSIGRDEGAVGEVLRTGEPVLLRDVAEYPGTPPRLRRIAELEEIHATCTVPIRAGGENFAVFNVSYVRPRELSDHDRRLLASLAQRAGLAIENARLYEQAQGKAALEERQRLARELHDSVSQVLYGIVLNASSADELMEPEESPARQLVRDVLNLAEAGLTEMRALIFELRPESLELEGLVAALERQAAATRARHGLRVHTMLPDDDPEMPLVAKEALYRIAQEALHNTVKHGRAHEVQLELRSEPGATVLRVDDDGRGFDPTGGFPGHLGLRSMRERAVAVGGEFRVVSAPGRGTQVEARLPHSKPA
jgi:PAS domain S-box-containing protein